MKEATEPNTERGDSGDCLKRLVMRDDDGEKVGDDDTVFFSYGIPPVRVLAPVKEIDGVLWALTPEHNPKRCKLKQLRRHVGSFYKA